MRDFKIFYDRTLSSTLDVLTGNKDLQLFRTKAEGYVIMANETGNSDINELLSIARDCMQPWLYITELNLTG